MIKEDLETDIEEAARSGDYKNLVLRKQEWMSVHLREISYFLEPLLPSVVNSENLFSVEDLKPCPESTSCSDRLHVFSRIDPDTGEPALKFVEDSRGACVPLTHIRTTAVRSIYEKMMEFIYNSAFPVRNPENHTGFWSSLTIRVNSEGKSMLVIEVYSLDPERSSVGPQFSRTLQKYLQKREKNLLTVVLKIHLANSVKNLVLYGTSKITENINNLDFTIDALRISSWNSEGEEGFCENLINLSRMEKHSWGLIQIGCLSTVSTITLAAVCLHSVVFNLDGEVRDLIVTDAKKNSVNLQIVAECTVTSLNGALTQRLSHAENICVVIYDVNTQLKDGDLVDTLRSCSKVNRILFAGRFEDPALLRRLVLCCSDHDGDTESFIVTKAVPVNLSPFNSNQIIIFVLERRSLIGNTLSNSMYNKDRVTEFLWGRKCKYIDAPYKDDDRYFALIPEKALLQSIFEMLQDGRPKSALEYEEQLKLKQECIWLQGQAVTALLWRVLPKIMKNQLPGFYIPLKGLKAPNFENNSSITFGAKPVKSENNPKKWIMKYGLIDDNDEITVPLKEIRSPRAKLMYEKTTKFIEGYGYPLYNTENKSGFWKFLKFKVNPEGLTMVVIGIEVDPEPQEAAQAMISDLESALKDSFKDNNLMSVILKVYLGETIQYKIVAGIEFMHEEVPPFKMFNYYGNMPWMNSYGALEIARAVVGMIAVDSTCSVVQFGRTHDAMSLYIAKCCQVLHVVHDDKETKRCLTYNCQLNLTNQLIMFHENPKGKDFMDIIRNKLSNVCCVIPDFSYYKKNVDVNFLKNTPNVKKIICISKLTDPVFINEIVSLCDGVQNENEAFIIKEVVPVDTSPHGNVIKTVTLLVRQSLVEDKVESNPIFNKKKLQEFYSKSISEKHTFLAEVCNLMKPCIATNSTRFKFFQSLNVSERVLLKNIIGMLQRGGPASVKEYKEQINWKHDLLWLYGKTFCCLLRELIPSVSTTRTQTPGFLFSMKLLKPCVFKETVCSTLYVDCTVCKDAHRTPFSLRFGLNCDEDGRFTVPLNEIHSPGIRYIYELMVRFIKHSGYELYNPATDTGVWINFKIRLNSKEKALLHISVKHHLELIDLLKEYFKPHEDLFESLVLKFLGNEIGLEKEVIIMGKECITEDIDGFKLNLCEPMSWFDPNGILQLSKIVIDLSCVDHTWTGIQLGSKYDLGYSIAKNCGKLHVLCKTEKMKNLIWNNAIQDGITNIRSHAMFTKLVKYTRKSKKVCLFIPDITLLQTPADVNVVTAEPNIKKIVCISKFTDPLILNLVVTSCNLKNGFLLKDAVPVDMSPHDNSVNVVLLLVRKSFEASNAGENKDFSVMELRKYSIMSTSQKHTLIASKIDDLTRSLAEFLDEKELFDRCLSFDWSTYDSDKQTLIKEIGEAGNPSAMEVVLKKVIDIKGNPVCNQQDKISTDQVNENNPSSSELQLLSLFADRGLVSEQVLLKNIITMLQAGGPASVKQYKEQIKWKHDLLWLYGKAFCCLLRELIPSVSTTRIQTPGFLFSMKPLKPCVLKETVCSTLYVDCTVCKDAHRTPFSLRFGLNCDEDGGFTVPLNEIHSPGIRYIYELMVTFIEHSGYELYNPTTDTGIWINFKISLNSKEKTLLHISVKPRFELIELLKEYFKPHEDLFESLVLKFLGNESGLEAEAIIMGKECITEDIDGFKLNLCEPMSWFDPNGILQLSKTVIDLSCVDQTWTGIQLGSKYDLGYSIAKNCGKLHVLCKTEKMKNLILNNAIQDGITNIRSYAMFTTLVKYTRKSQKVCLFIPDITLLQTPADVNVVTAEPNIKKIVCISKFTDPLLVNLVVTSCNLVNSFIIKDAVPVDMSPHDNCVNVVLLLVRKSFEASNAEENKDFSVMERSKFSILSTSQTHSLIASKIDDLTRSFAEFQDEKQLFDRCLSFDWATYESDKQTLIEKKDEAGKTSILEVLRDEIIDVKEDPGFSQEDDSDKQTLINKLDEAGHPAMEVLCDKVTDMKEDPGCKQDDDSDNQTLIKETDKASDPSTMKVLYNEVTGLIEYPRCDQDYDSDKPTSMKEIDEAGNPSATEVVCDKVTYMIENPSCNQENDSHKQTLINKIDEAGRLSVCDKVIDMKEDPGSNQDDDSDKQISMKEIDGGIPSAKEVVRDKVSDMKGDPGSNEEDDSYKQTVIKEVDDAGNPSAMEVIPDEVIDVNEYPGSNQEDDSYKQTLIKEVDDAGNPSAMEVIPDEVTGVNEDPGSNQEDDSDKQTLIKEVDDTGNPSAMEVIPDEVTDVNEDPGSNQEDDFDKQTLIMEGHEAENPSVVEVVCDEVTDMKGDEILSDQVNENNPLSSELQLLSLIADRGLVLPDEIAKEIEKILSSQGMETPNLDKKLVPVKALNKDIISMINAGGPKTIDEYHKQLRWKHECTWLQAKALCSIIARALPHVVQVRTQGFLFYMNGVKACPFTKTVAEALCVKSEVSRNDPNEIIMRHNAVLPVESIYSEKVAGLFTKMMVVINSSKYPLHHPKKNTGYWKHFTIRVNSVGESMLTVTVVCPRKKVGTQTIVSCIKVLLLKNFASCDVDSLVLEVFSGFEYNKIVLRGELHLPEIVGNLDVKLCPHALWSNPYGILEVCRAIVNMASLDDTWAVIQLGQGYDVVHLYVAKHCGILHMQSLPIYRKHVEDNAKVNLIKNITYSENLTDILKSKELSSYSNICVVIPELINFDEDAVCLLKDEPKIKKIICVSEFTDPLFIDRIVSSCFDDQNSEKSFVIMDVTPVDISPWDNLVKIVALLTRKYIVKVDHNQEFSEYESKELLAMTDTVKRNKMNQICNLVEPFIATRDEKSLYDQTLKFPLESEHYNEHKCSSGKSDQYILKYTVSKYVKSNKFYSEIEKMLTSDEPKTRDMYKNILSHKEAAATSLVSSLCDRLRPFQTFLFTCRKENFRLVENLRPCPVIPTLSERIYVPLAHKSLNPQSNPRSSPYSDLYGRCQTDPGRRTYNLLMQFIQKSQYHIYNPSIGSGFWDYFIIRTDSTGNVYIVVVVQHHPEDSKTFVSLLKQHLVGASCPDYNVVSLDVRVIERGSLKLASGFGLQMATEVIDDFHLKFNFKNILTYNRYGIKNLCTAVVELAELDKKWQVLQVGTECGIDVFHLAEKCNWVHYAERDKRFGIDIMAEVNGAKNITVWTLQNDKNKLRKILENEIKDQENMFVVEYFTKDFEAPLNKENDEFLPPAAIRKCTNIKKIIYVSELSDSNWESKLKICCLQNPDWGRPFVIKKFLTIDMSPFDNHIMLVCLLTREIESAINSVIIKNLAYSTSEVKKVLDELEKDAYLVEEMKHKNIKSSELTLSSQKSEKGLNIHNTQKSEIDREKGDSSSVSEETTEIPHVPRLKRNISPVKDESHDRKVPRLNSSENTAINNSQTLGSVGNGAKHDQQHLINSVKFGLENTTNAHTPIHCTQKSVGTSNKNTTTSSNLSQNKSTLMGTCFTSSEQFKKTATDTINISTESSSCEQNNRYPTGTFGVASVQQCPQVPITASFNTPTEISSSEQYSQYPTGATFTASSDIGSVQQCQQMFPIANSNTPAGFTASSNIGSVQQCQKMFPIANSNTPAGISNTEQYNQYPTGASFTASSNIGSVQQCQQMFPIANSNTPAGISNSGQYSQYPTGATFTASSDIGSVQQCQQMFPTANSNTPAGLSNSGQYNQYPTGATFTASSNIGSVQQCQQMFPIANSNIPAGISNSGQYNQYPTGATFTASSDIGSVQQCQQMFPIANSNTPAGISNAGQYNQYPTGATFTASLGVCGIQQYQQMPIPASFNVPTVSSSDNYKQIVMNDIQMGIGSSQQHNLYQTGPTFTALSRVYCVEQYQQTPSLASFSNPTTISISQQCQQMLPTASFNIPSTVSSSGQYQQMPTVTTSSESGQYQLIPTTTTFNITTNSSSKQMLTEGNTVNLTESGIVINKENVSLIPLPPKETVVSMSQYHKPETLPVDVNKLRRSRFDIMPVENNPPKSNTLEKFSSKGIVQGSTQDHKKTLPVEDTTIEESQFDTHKGVSVARNTIPKSRLDVLPVERSSTISFGFQKLLVKDVALQMASHVDLQEDSIENDVSEKLSVAEKTLQKSRFDVMPVERSSTKSDVLVKVPVKKTMNKEGTHDVLNICTIKETTSKRSAHDEIKGNVQKSKFDAHFKEGTSKKDKFEEVTMKKTREKEATHNVVKKYPLKKASLERESSTHDGTEKLLVQRNVRESRYDEHFKTSTAKIDLFEKWRIKKAMENEVVHDIKSCPSKESSLKSSAHDDTESSPWKQNVKKSRYHEYFKASTSKSDTFKEMPIKKTMEKNAMYNVKSYRLKEASLKSYAHDDTERLHKEKNVKKSRYDEYLKASTRNSDTFEEMPIKKTMEKVAPDNVKSYPLKEASLKSSSRDDTERLRKEKNVKKSRYDEYFKASTLKSDMFEEMPIKKTMEKEAPDNVKSNSLKEASLKSSARDNTERLLKEKNVNKSSHDEYFKANTAKGGTFEEMPIKRTMEKDAFHSVVKRYPQKEPSLKSSTHGDIERLPKEKNVKKSRYDEYFKASTLKSDMFEEMPFKETMEKEAPDNVKSNSLKEASLKSSVRDDIERLPKEKNVKKSRYDEYFKANTAKDDMFEEMPIKGTMEKEAVHNVKSYTMKEASLKSAVHDDTERLPKEKIGKKSRYDEYFKASIAKDNMFEEMPIKKTMEKDAAHNVVMRPPLKEASLKSSAHDDAERLRVENSLLKSLLGVLFKKNAAKSNALEKTSVKKSVEYSQRILKEKSVEESSRQSSEYYVPQALTLGKNYLQSSRVDRLFEANNKISDTLMEFLKSRSVAQESRCNVLTKRSPVMESVAQSSRLNVSNDAKYGLDDTSVKTLSQNSSDNMFQRGLFIENMAPIAKEHVLKRGVVEKIAQSSECGLPARDFTEQSKRPRNFEYATTSSCERDLLHVGEERNRMKLVHKFGITEGVPEQVPEKLTLWRPRTSQDYTTNISPSNTVDNLFCRRNDLRSQHDTISQEVIDVKTCDRLGSTAGETDVYPKRSTLDKEDISAVYARLQNFFRK